MSTSQTWIEDGVEIQLYTFAHGNVSKWCEWDSDGTKIAESWLVGGEYHRTDGPATCEWNSDGTVSSAWYMDGKSYTEDEVRRILARKSMQDKVLRASRLLKLGQEVPKLYDNILSAVGRFLD